MLQHGKRAMNRGTHARLRGRLLAAALLSLAPLPGCDAAAPPVDGSPPVPVQHTGGGSNPGASAGGAAAGGAAAGGGSLNHTDCFQGCSMCVGDIYYSAPSHPAYVGDCCTAATQQVCEFGCQVYVGCLPSPIGMGGLGGAAAAGGSPP